MPPPPPQTPAREESGPPLNDRPGQKAGDFVERDLWNLDEEETGTAGKAPAAEQITPRKKVRRGGKSLPDKEPPPQTNPSPATETPRPEAAEEPVETLLPAEGAGIDDPPGPDDAPQDGAVSIARTEWFGEDENLPQPESGEAKTPPPADPAPSASADAPAENARSGIASEFDNEPAAGPATAPARATRLSTVELVSLGILLLAILAGGAWAVRTFFTEIPTRQSKTLIPSFPVRGDKTSVKAAKTFWRKPVRSGANPDTARSAAELIPVLELELTPGAGQGTLRFFFRDDQARLVGDSVTREFSGGTFTSGTDARAEVAATDGFDDEGKHAAYQTAQTEPWTVEVFEGPHATASFENFTLLFKMPISTDRH